MRQPHELPGNHSIPNIGDRLELVRNDVSLRGTVHYADSMQVLVKWDNGSSSSLRVGRDDFRVLLTEPAARAVVASRLGPDGIASLPRS
jgi:hypothetical protein